MTEPTTSLPPIPEDDEILAGDNNHANTGDDSEAALPEDAAADEFARAGDAIGELDEAPAEPASANHPANPAVVPIRPRPPETETRMLGLEERAEKGRLLAEELKAIKELEAKRAKIGADITARKKNVDLLMSAVITGAVEVAAGVPQDMFRAPVGGQAAAEAFDEMAAEAAAAGETEASQVGQEGAKEEAELNAMAAEVQAEQGITEPGPQFLNDIENHKAKVAARGKGKA